MSDIPGEEREVTPLSSTRELVTAAVREFVRRGRDRNERRKILVEAFQIVTYRQIVDPISLSAAQVMIRGMIESGCDWRHIDEGITTALSIIRFADDGKETKIVTS